MKTKVSVNHIFVILSGLISGLIVLGGNYFAEKGLSLYEISLLSAILPISVLGLIVLSNKRYAFKKENFFHFIFYGFICSIAILAQFAAVILGTPVALVVFCLYTQPLWTILISRILFKEKFTKIRLIACSIVILGLIFLINPFQADNVGNIEGIIISIIGGLGLSGWIIYGGFFAKRGNNPINTSFGGSLFCTLFIILSYPVISQFTSDESITRFSLNFPVTILIVLLLYGFLTQVINPLCYLKGVRKVSVVDAGIIMLLEPVSGAILASIFFDQALTWNIIVGAAFILVANYLVIRGSK